MRYVIGIDEVGRGSLAGPVVVAAVCMPAHLRPKTKNLKLRDSKKLTAKQREEWAAYIKIHPRINFAIARVYPRGIEKLNISGAANLAALRAVRYLSTRYSLLSTRCKIYLDGGLYLGSKKNTISINQSNPLISVRTIVRGDEKIKAVAIASIVAKVHRDRLMVRLAKRYPEYGFEVHKGYGTKAHLRAIKKNGPSDAHRLTFLS
jgi:ribonuclease HII